MRRGKTELVCSRRNVPLGCLAATDVGSGLLRLFSQAGSAVGILFTDRLAIGQVLSAVDDDDQSTNLGPVDCHVRENASGRRAGEGEGLGLRCHVVVVAA